jgi:threonine dehydrogenase-like Zn-dependent dehydrogenase
VVIEASGVPAVLSQALDLCRQGGRISLLGSTRGLVDGLDVYSTIHRHNLSLVGAHLYGCPDPQARIRHLDALVVDLVLQERLQLRPLISAVHSPAACEINSRT